MKKFAVIVEHDWPELMVVEAKNETEALEIAVCNTIKWCIQCNRHWVMGIKPGQKFVGDSLGCNGTPVREVILAPIISDDSSEIRLWMPSNSEIT